MNEAIGAVIIALLLINLVGLLMVGSRVSGQSQDSRQMESRLTKLEARVDNLPTHRDLQQLGRGVTDTAEAIATLSGQTRAMTDMLRTIQEHLLQQDPRR